MSPAGDAGLLCFVTDQASLPDDYDMDLLLEACRDAGLRVEVACWDDPAVDWGLFRSVVLRSPWSYLTRLPAFLAWCEAVDEVTDLQNPLRVVRWTLDKRYLADLAALDVPTVPTWFVDSTSAIDDVLEAMGTGSVVIKPAVGAYSKDVASFGPDARTGASEHLRRLTSTDRVALVQPYMRSIDALGETDLIFVDGSFSHAIRKESLLDDTGVAGEPTQDVRSARDPEPDELDTAKQALAAAATVLGLDEPLLYARVDLVRDDDGRPCVHEMELCEPSLSLPFSDGAAARFVDALARHLRRALTRA